ncbi:MAG TPA: hypothetical protein DCP03_01130 [Polaromonas sp.]|nr:hypothetical protein [Polaromonas sp.]
MVFEKKVRDVLHLEAGEYRSHHPPSHRKVPASKNSVGLAHKLRGVPLDCRPKPTFEDQLVELRVYLIRFARLQLRNDDWAACF